MTTDKKQLQEQKKASALVIRSRIQALNLELIGTPVKIPPRFQSAFSDFETWLDQTYPDQCSILTSIQSLPAQTTS